MKFRTIPIYSTRQAGQPNLRGFTIPLLINQIDLREDIAGKVDCESLQILLHELTHRCGAEEWQPANVQVATPVD